MLDINDLLNSIKKAASEAVEASKPVALMYGKVLSVEPLEINVEQKMVLHSAQLVLTRNVSNYTTEVTIAWDSNNTQLNANHTHNLNGDISVNSSATINPNPDNQQVNISNEISNNMSVAQKSINLTHAHSITGKKKIIIHNGLNIDDEVLLLRMQGGQKYIVIDKVV